MEDLAGPAGRRFFFSPGAFLLGSVVVCATARSSHHYTAGRTGRFWASLNNAGPFHQAKNLAGDLASASKLPFVSRRVSSLLDIRGGAAPGAVEPTKEEATEESPPEVVELYLPGLLETVIQRIRKVRKTYQIIRRETHALH
jgi:hypothetical protein